MTGGFIGVVALESHLGRKNTFFIENEIRILLTIQTVDHIIKCVFCVQWLNHQLFTFILTIKSCRDYRQITTTWYLYHRVFDTLQQTDSNPVYGFVYGIL